MRVARLGLLALLALAGCKLQDRVSPIDFGIGIGEPPSGGPQPLFDEPAKTAAKSPAPLIGGTVLVLAGGATALVADPDRDQVQIVDLTHGKVSFTVALSPGDEPGRAVQDAAGLVHVAARRGGALVSINPQTGLVTTRRAVCAAPRGVAYEASTDLLHVACAGGELVSLPATGGAAVRTVRLERDLRDVIASHGTLIVSTFRTAQLLVLAADGTVAKRFALPSSSDPFSGQPFASAVAWRMQTLPDGRILIVHQQGAVGEVQVTQGGYGGGGGCGSIVRTALAIFDPTSMAMSAATPVPGVVLAADFSVAGKQGTVAVMSAGNAHTPGLTTVATMPLAVVVGPPVTVPGDMGDVDAGVDGGFVDPNPGDGIGGCGQVGSGTTVPGEPIALAYDGNENLWVQLREPAQLVRADGTVTVQLASDSRADTGWAVFHSNSGAELACASCHAEGGDDSRTWNFQDVGPRRTQTLRGHIGGTEPFHWGGDLHDFGSLLGEVYIKRMSGPTLMTDQSSRLFAWINTIPELPQSPPADSAAVARGQALFEAPTVTGCNSCHSGAQMTNNATVDVSTGGLFQVPRLIGVAWRAPFLHDGCAQTLTDRFGPCGGSGDLHGFTSKLTAAQIADLVAYLETI
jgi:mono/diheme cytochrome c family protein